MKPIHSKNTVQSNVLYDVVLTLKLGRMESRDWFNSCKSCNDFSIFL